MRANPAGVYLSSLRKPLVPLPVSENAVTDRTSGLDLGIYTRADAARLLGVTPTRLSRWVAGYTYYLKAVSSPVKVRHRPPLITTELPAVRDKIALSFVELMELRVVKALVKSGIPLQRVRIAGEILSQNLQIRHPFASRRVFSDGRSVYGAISEDGDAPDVIKLTRKHHQQIISGKLFEQFLSEMDFNEDTALAVRWWPLGKGKPIVLDPRIAFGAPTIAGTRIRTSVLAFLVSDLPVSEVARDYSIPRTAVRAAWDFERDLVAA